MIPSSVPQAAVRALWSAQRGCGRAARRRGVVRVVHLAEFPDPRRPGSDIRKASEIRGKMFGMIGYW